MRSLPLWLVLWFIAIVAVPLAQQPGVERPVFRASTRLVVQAVSVKDRDGRPIEGLTIDDFIVTEDGEPQAISFVEYQRVGDRVSLPPFTADLTSQFADPPVAAVVQGISAPPGGTAGAAYRNRRLVVLYFDLSALPMADRFRAHRGAMAYIEQQITASELVAIMAFQQGAVRVKQDFTDNRAILREVLQVMFFGQDADGDGIADDTDLSSAFGQNDGEFAILNTDRQLAALQTAVSMLEALPEQKSLVYFSSGLRLNGVDNHAQLKATTNAALRANVALFPIDARGLVALPPIGDARQASPGGIGMFTGRLAETANNRLQRSQDTLYALARDTGGKAFFDYNDLSIGIRQAAEAITDYYLIGFQSTHTDRDGRFRRVRVSLAPSRAGLSVDISYREGYFADKEFARFTEADKERQLEEALMLENPITEVTIAVEVNYFQLSSAEYFIPVSVKIPGSELALAQGRRAARTLIDVIGEVKDNAGITVQNVRDKLDIPLDAATAAELSSRPIQYETGFTLLPGTYTMKLLARDSVTGRIGTYQTTFTVPNLNRDTGRVPISTVVLSSQRVAANSALFNVAKNQTALDAVNPLVVGGQRLLPSVTRVFNGARTLHVLLQAYQREAATTQPLVAYVTFFQNDTKAFETRPVSVTEGQPLPRSRAVPLYFEIPLANLAPGTYECQVTVLDSNGAKAAFWRAPLVVTP